MAYQLDTLKFPLYGTRLIEASAGTGKTYTIAALYLRLILGHGNENGFFRPLTPPEILVVTFTNAATEELRDRIRSRLSEAAACFRKRAEGDDYIKRLQESFPEETWPQQANLLENAAQWMDEAAIHTIHAWCQRMLRQHAFESGSLFDLELAADDDDLLEEAACDYWRINLYHQPAETLKDIMYETGCRTPGQLLSRVRQLLGIAVSDKDPFFCLEQRKSIIEKAREAWALSFNEGTRLILDAQADKTLNGNKYRPASLKNWIGQLSDWINKNATLPEEQALLKLSGTGLGQGTSKNKSAPEHPVFDVFDRLREDLKNHKVKEAFLNHAAREINWLFLKKKERLALVGFDDLLTRLESSLKESVRLSSVIAGQFPVALIDEFQDTDPVQYSIFREIYLKRKETGLFMIGDPKQAIYAFRGADIHTYLKARKDAGKSHYTLGTNYRSTSAVVNSVNRLFQTAAENPEGPFMFREKIPFEPVNAQGRDEELFIDDRPVSGMTLWQMAQNQPVPKTGSGGYLDTMAASFASEITRILNLASENRAFFQTGEGEKRKVCPADIALLVRNGTEASAIRKSLSARGVRSVYLSDRDSVFETGEAKTLSILLRACFNPEDSGALRSALAMPILGKSIRFLDLLNRDETVWEEETERFRNFRHIWQKRGVLPMLHSLLHEYGIPARLLAEKEGERSLTNLLHLSEILQEASRRLDGELPVIRWFTHHVFNPESAPDNQILRLESDEELVRVITIHKSKGLEYPLVFLPFICSYREITADNSPLVKYHDADGRVYVGSPLQEKDIEAAERERLAEDLRMLYVAVTRSRHSCWLGIGVMGRSLKNGEKSQLHLSGLGYLLAYGNPVATAESGAMLEALKGDCSDIAIGPLPDPGGESYVSGQEPEKPEPAEKFSGIVPGNWWITSYSGILSGAGLEDFEKALQNIPDSASEDQIQEAESEISVLSEINHISGSVHRFHRGPEPGTFLHNILEWAAVEGFGKVSSNRKLLFDRISQNCIRRGWTDWAETLTDWIIHLLKTPINLPDKSGSLALCQLSDDKLQPELEFMFAAHGVDTGYIDREVISRIIPKQRRPVLRENQVNGMFKGFIDLVFCHNGRYYILDYKSNYLGENETAYLPDNMIQAMLEHRYDLQYVLYTLAMHRLLKARLPGYDYEKNMGGAIYLFLRGMDKSGKGIYTDKPPRNLIERLDRCFAEKENNHVA